MADTVLVNSELRLRVSYVDDDGVDPESAPTVIVIDSEDVSTSLGSATQEDVGLYYVDWTPTTVGTYTIRFAATFEGASDPVVTNIVIIVVATTDAITLTLGEDVISFMMSLPDPLFVDPDEIAAYYTDAPYVDIVETIFRFSTEVRNFFPDDVPFTAVEYVRAATLCSLSKIYDYGVEGDEGNVSLGDLSFSSRSFPKIKITRANATGWCELAGALRAEMLRLTSGKPRSFLKASSWGTPIPYRHLRKKDTV